MESELRGDFEELILGLMMTPTEYDAYCLHDAMEGVGTSEAALIGILCTRNAKVGQVSYRLRKMTKVLSLSDV